MQGGAGGAERGQEGPRAAESRPKAGPKAEGPRKAESRPKAEGPRAAKGRGRQYNS